MENKELRYFCEISVLLESIIFWIWIPEFLNSVFRKKGRKILLISFPLYFALLLLDFATAKMADRVHFRDGWEERKANRNGVKEEKCSLNSKWSCKRLVKRANEWTCVYSIEREKEREMIWRVEGRKRFPRSFYRRVYRCVISQMARHLPCTALLLYFSTLFLSLFQSLRYIMHGLHRVFNVNVFPLPLSFRPCSFPFSIFSKFLFFSLCFIDHSFTIFYFKLRYQCYILY